MIFQTQNQVNNFLIFVFFGLIIGLISSIYFLIFFKNFQKIIVKNVLNLIFYTFFCIFYIFLTNIFNFGNFSLVLLFAYYLPYIFIKHITRKLVGVLEKKWYTIITNKLTFVKLKNKKGKPTKWKIKPKSNF